MDVSFALELVVKAYERNPYRNIKPSGVEQVKAKKLYAQQEGAHGGRCVSSVAAMTKTS